MRIHYETDTGWPSQLTTMRSRIGALVRNSTGFKIGITNWPEMRAQAYQRDYTDMVVVYATSSRKNAADLETWLIDFYRNNHRATERLDNDRGGGGGRWGEGWVLCLRGSTLVGTHGRADK